MIQDDESDKLSSFTQSDVCNRVDVQLGPSPSSRPGLWYHDGLLPDQTNKVSNPFVVGVFSGIEHNWL